ncbi:MAG: hypothetical protein U9Q07_09210, partial [Planctomycetota bacterium]|nr:hypothetical protein [Planctomycetota bacterium]
LASPKIARIRDVNTRLPAGLCPPWDRIMSAPRQHLLAFGRHLSAHSKQVAKLRQSPRGTRLLSSRGWLFSHDAALAHCRPYRSLVETAIENLSEEFFDVATVKRLFEDDLSSGAPRMGKLFQTIVSFSGFDGRWGPNATREVPMAGEGAGGQDDSEG